MSAPTVVLICLAAGTYLLKAAVPLALGERQLPAWLGRAANLLPAALLAALVGVSTATEDGALAVDARLVGLAAAGGALAARAPFPVVVVVASAATAVTRLA